MSSLKLKASALVQGFVLSSVAKAGKFLLHLKQWHLFLFSYEFPRSDRKLQSEAER